MKKVIRLISLSVLLAAGSATSSFAQQCQCVNLQGFYGVIYIDGQGNERCGVGCQIITENLAARGDRPITELSKWSVNRILDRFDDPIVRLQAR
ncbi:MAG TPA: hypothetical protein VE961_25050 [Pyrinomonadaceae bacterium]|nr:hypothetical protein [Pyrinomonadaceae bacterium]